MCRRVVCEKCSKPTFAGCGAHIEQVLGDVPIEKRCTCRAWAKPPEPTAREASDAQGKSKWWPFARS
jgi:hypothetical protein